MPCSRTSSPSPPQNTRFKWPVNRTILGCWKGEPVTCKKVRFRLLRLHNGRDFIVVQTKRSPKIEYDWVWPRPLAPDLCRCGSVTAGGVRARQLPESQCPRPEPATCLSSQDRSVSGSKHPPFCWRDFRRLRRAARRRGGAPRAMPAVPVPRARPDRPVWRARR